MLGFHPYFDTWHNWTAELSAVSPSRTLPAWKYLGTHFC